MTLTDRDKKLAMVLTPLVLVVAFWFLVLAPKRSEAQSLQTKLEQVEQTRDSAVAQAGGLEGSRKSYAKDYATVVRLGKAIPGTIDMPSLLVQLDEAARGTRIRFGKVTTGSREGAPPAAPSAPPAGGTSSGSTPPAAPAGNAAPGGAPAQSAPGQPVETAGNAVQDGNQTSAAQGGGTATAPAPAPGTTATTGVAAPGLENVPLTFEFTGGFFDLADFFHEMKRFVYLANDRVRVEGRLMTIDGFKFDSTSFPDLKAEVQATVYLAPKTQGATAGASPTGPAPLTPASTEAAPTTAPPASTPPASTPPATTPADTSVGVQ